MDVAGGEVEDRLPDLLGGDLGAAAKRNVEKIGRASCRERV